MIIIIHKKKEQIKTIFNLFCYCKSKSWLLFWIPELLAVFQESHLIGASLQPSFDHRLNSSKLCPGPYQASWWFQILKNIRQIGPSPQLGGINKKYKQ